MVGILLATYNGEQYIEEQLISLLNQTYTDFKIFINDDASNDSTIKILKIYQNKFPGKIVITKNKKNTGSAKHNFFSLMKRYQEEYIMLCDQDDVWDKQKVEISLNKIKQLEKIYGKYTPILVHTDLQVVDEKLNILDLSFKHQVQIDFSRNKLNYMLSQNIITGCTVLMNKALLDYIEDEPEYYVMHDWWIGLIAASFGVIDNIDKPMVKYRQHDKNEEGTATVRKIKYKIKRLMKKDKIKQNIYNSYAQAEVFFNMYQNQLTQEKRNMYKEYIQLKKYSKLKKIRILSKYKLFKKPIRRKLAQVFYG